MKKEKNMGPKVKNQKVIRRLAKRIVFENPKKSAIVIASIALCTFLFTALFTVGGSMVVKLEETTARQSGGTADVTFKYLNDDEYNLLLKDEKLKEVSKRVFVACAVNDELLKLRTEVWSAEEREAEKMFCAPEAGRMPKEKNEILVSNLFLQAFGYDATSPDTYEKFLGTKLSLDLSKQNQTETKEFVVSGIYTGDRVSMAQIAFVSEAFQKEYTPTPKESYYDDDTLGMLDGYIDVDVDYYFPLGLSQQAKATVMRDHLPENIQVGINWALMGGSMDVTTLLLVVVLLLTIFLSGYLIINNIYRINVYTDIRAYGLLKTVGCSGKQLKRVVNWQSVYHALPGIVLGMIGGAFVGSLILPVVMKNMVFSDTTNTKVELNVWVFLLSALFSYLTVRISVKKATKIASKVSPVEALRFTERISKKKKSKTKSNRFSAFRFAYQNVFRDSKRCFFMVLSLALSMVVLNSVYTLIQGFDEDKYVAQFIKTDFSVSDATTDNPAMPDHSYDGVSDTFISEAKKQKGVLKIGSIYGAESSLQTLNDRDWSRVEERLLDNSNVDTWMRDMMTVDAGEGGYDIDKEHQIIAKIYGMDDYALDNLTLKQGVIDYEKFATGKYVIMNEYSENIEGGDSVAYFEPGETVTLTNPNGESRDYEVMATVMIPFAIGIQSFEDLNISYILPSKEFLEFIENKTAMRTLIDMDPECEDSMEKWMANYTTTVESNLTYTSREVYKKEFKDFIQVFRVVGGLLTVVLALIGILNLINILVTSILARRLELAMLEAVGMTKKMQKKIMCLEGLLYGTMAAVSGILLSSLASVTLVRAFGIDMWYYSYHFTLLPILYMIPLMIAVVIVISIIVYRSTMNNSVVERLRLAEA